MRILTAIGFAFTVLLLQSIAVAEEPLPPAPESEEATAEEPESTVDVLLDADTVMLKDGSSVKGTVILEAEKATIVLTEDGERLVPTEDIEQIVRVKDKDNPITLPVRESDGFRFIVMEPVEQDTDSGDNGDAANGDVSPDRLKRIEIDPDKLKDLKDDDELDELLKKAKEAADNQEKSKDKKRDDNKNPDTPPPPTAKW